jgi:hypothetical protein
MVRTVVGETVLMGYDNPSRFIRQKHNIVVFLSNKSYDITTVVNDMNDEN